MQNRVEILKNTDRQALRERVVKIAPLLPYEYIQIIQKAYPQYDNEKGRIKIRNVKHLIAADPELTEILEKVATAHQKMITNLKK